MIKAVLFDLDGTIVEATEWHYLSLNKALEEVSGITIARDEHISTFNGLPTKKKLELLYQRGRVKPEDGAKIWERKQHYTKETILETAKIDYEKVEMHNYLHSEGLLIACVTNSIRQTTELMLKSTGQLDFMDLIISNEDVLGMTKPLPNCWFRAMIALSVFPEECIIVEDSPVGIQSALATSAYVWQVKGCHEVTLDNFIKFRKMVEADEVV